MIDKSTTIIDRCEVNLSQNHTMQASSALDQLLTSRLHRVARFVDRDDSDACAKACQLGIAETRCLAAIGAHDTLSLVDLARLANQDKGQASRSVQALVDRGFVRKEASAADARSIELTLTRSGKPLYARVLRALEASNAVTFAVLTTAERKTLGALLDRVSIAIDGDGAHPG